MCFFSRSGFRPVINPPPSVAHLDNSTPTFRYNSMFNFIRVSFCFFVNFRVGLGIGLGFGIGNLKIFDRWRCRHSGHPRPLDACIQTNSTLVFVYYFHENTYCKLLLMDNYVTRDMSICRLRCTFW